MDKLEKPADQMSSKTTADDERALERQGDIIDRWLTERVPIFCDPVALKDEVRDRSSPFLSVL